jgi:hypothetical protein
LVYVIASALCEAIPNDAEIASAEVRRLAMTFDILNRDSGCTLEANPV